MEPDYREGMEMGHNDTDRKAYREKMKGFVSLNEYSLTRGGGGGPGQRACSKS